MSLHEQATHLFNVVDFRKVANLDIQIIDMLSWKPKLGHMESSRQLKTSHLQPSIWVYRPRAIQYFDGPRMQAANAQGYRP